MPSADPQSSRQDRPRTYRRRILAIAVAAGAISAAAAYSASPVQPPVEAAASNAAAPRSPAHPPERPAADRGQATSQGARRSIVAAPVGIVVTPDAPRGPAADALVIDVPVYVQAASAIRAVEIRCNVFARALGDLIGTGQATRAVPGGAFAETVPVTITPRPGKSRARPARYSCAASFSTAGDEPSAMPAGPAAAPERRTAYERALGRPIAAFSDRADGEIRVQDRIGR